MVVPFFVDCICFLKSYFQENRESIMEMVGGQRHRSAMGVNKSVIWRHLRSWLTLVESREAAIPRGGRRSWCTHRQVRGQRTRALRFSPQQLFFLFSDLCPGDSNLENEGVAAQDAATYTYLIEMISFDDGDGKAGGRAEWQLPRLVGSSPGLWVPRVHGPLCCFLPIQHKTFSLIS